MESRKDLGSFQDKETLNILRDKYIYPYLVRDETTHAAQQMCVNFMSVSFLYKIK